MRKKDLVMAPVDPIWKRTLVRAGLRLSFKWPSLLPLPVGILRKGMDASARVFKVRDDVLIQPSILGGVPGEVLRLQQGARKLHILHFHGGAFFTGSCHTHRALAAEMAARCQAVVHLLDHRLAPEHPYPAALHDGLVAWQALLNQGVPPQHIVLSGDSGGCAQVLALVQHLRDRRESLPAALYMMSPYLDLRLRAASVQGRRWGDPMVTAHALRRGGDAYRRGISVDDPRVSPLLGSLKGLPPALVQVGSDEILLDDALNFRQFAHQAGCVVQLVQYQGYWHNFQMFAGTLRAADQALNELAHFVRLHVPLDHVVPCRAVA
ncbi:MAG TPA: alpha/beta hydrolase [Aquabacterium sp.]|uniref:alpha/beta hydrolase n=1 Tax=Aquabacterium sp. TaxID=1872578 RepID=UPI002E348DEA|nr:alpha/beta hydrolase [Aquabacterium sp.]HEX5354803.1 alpha/beta hydrolase [Aquabacterium sp.]